MPTFSHIKLFVDCTLAFLALISIVVSVLINLLIMLYAKVISAFLTRINFMEASIRITGLIVATIGIQMVLDGITDYIKF